MKLLSICIPTYNRPNNLKELYKSFLCPALEKYRDQIEIVVCDNSDEENACLNQIILGDEVYYYKNFTNIGFEGNLIRCVREATGQFIWIISDDDTILWDGFKSLMDCMEIATNDCIDCIILPINYCNIFGKTIKHKKQSDGEIKEDMDVLTYVKTLSTVPFGYFSATAICLDKKRLNWVEKEFHGNIILNIPLFLCMLKHGSKLRFLDIPIIEYKQRYYVRMDPFRFYMGARDVIMFLEKEYHIDGKLLIDHTYKESLLMILAHRIKLQRYLNGDAAQWQLLAKLGQNLNIKTIVLAVMVSLPVALVRQPYLIYISLNLTGADGSFSIGKIISRFKNLSFKDAISRYRTLLRFIHSKQNERRSLK